MAAGNLRPAVVPPKRKREKVPNSLWREMIGNQEGGESLPMPFPELEAMGATFRRGQTAIVAASPGGGKSAFMVNYAARVQRPILYFSPDSDINSIGPRFLAVLTERSMSRILREIDGKSDAAEQHYETAKGLRHVQFCFQPMLTFNDIELELMAYENIFGHFPEMIILDNVKDVIGGGGGDGSDWQRHSATVDFFHALGKAADISCVLLHHLTGQYDDGLTLPSLSALQGKISKQARLVLTLFSPEGPQSNEIAVHVAKATNSRRHGPEEYITLNWDRETQIIH